MRVVHCEGGAEWRGGQQQLLLLARGLDRLGCAQTVVARRAAHRARFRQAGLAGLHVRRALAAPAALRNADIVHAHDGHAWMWLPASRLPLLGAGRAARLFTRRVAFAPARGDAWKYRRLDAVIAVSAHVRAQLLAIGVPPGRVHVIPDAVDLEALPEAGAARAAVRARLGLPEGARCLACLAAFTPEKGVADLLRALPGLPDAVLLLPGAGPGEEGLRSLAQELGIGARVMFCAGLDAASVVAAADVLAMPSRAEGLGSALLLAMALERPAVGTAVGGIPELIEDGVTGLLVPAAAPPALARACRRLLDDAALAARLCDAAAARVRERFTLAAVAAGTLALYERLRAGRSA